MKINKVFKGEELQVGDVFSFNFKELMDSPFSNSYFGRDLAEKNVDMVYIQLVDDPERTMNVTNYRIYYVKDNDIIEKNIQHNALFFSYLMQRGEGYIKKLFNSDNHDLSLDELRAPRVYTSPSNAKESITDKPLNLKTATGQDIVYGDIVELDYGLIKKTHKNGNGQEILNSNFVKKLNEFNVDSLYIHVRDDKDINQHCFSSPTIFFYTLSNGKIQNGDTDQDKGDDRIYYRGRDDNAMSHLKNHIGSDDNCIPFLERIEKLGVLKNVVNNSLKSKLFASDLLGKQKTLINKKVDGQEAAVGDIYVFDTKDFNHPRFESYFLNKSLSDEGIDKIYAEICFPQNGLNILGLQLTLVKKGDAEDYQYHESPLLISHILSLDSIKKVEPQDCPSCVNKSDHVLHGIDNITDVMLGIKDNTGRDIDYGDILQVNYDGLKKVLNDDFIAILEEKNTAEVFFHLLPLNHAGFTEPDANFDYFPTSLSYKIYAVSDEGIENEFTKKERDHFSKKYQETGNSDYILQNYIHSDSINPGMIRTLAERNLIEKVVGATYEKNLQMDDLKPPRRRRNFGM